MPQDFDCIILGAGGAGLMAAITAGKRAKKALLIDRAAKPGGKILVSGGGRCNFTNLNAGPGNYISQNPHFAKSALARFSPKDFIALVEKHRIPYHEKKLGQLFCDKSARDILEMLLAECREAGAQFALGNPVEKVAKAAQGFAVTVAGEAYAAPALVVATGGLSFPKLGATDFGYALARQFGLAVTPRHAALDGFVFGPKELADFEGLAGVAAEAAVQCGGRGFREALLFTHVGLSGPAALQASLYWEAGAELNIEFMPPLPRRLEQRLKALNLEPSEWKFTPERTVGYAKAEVTRGGVDTDEISSKTMEAKKLPGLYFVGEVLDVTGQLGGYNFQWAWASGFAAGSAL
jgi:predicted Rossmann fold flavoprotein